MYLAEKQELVRLLNVYMNEICMDNDRNIKEANEHKEKRWLGMYKHGLKAQYEHARILSTKLSCEINRELKVF